MCGRKSGGVRTEVQDGKRSQEGDEEGLVRETGDWRVLVGTERAAGSSAARRPLVTVLEQVHCLGSVCPPQQAGTTLSSSYGEGTGAGAELAEGVGNPKV